MNYCSKCRIAHARLNVALECQWLCIVSNKVSSSSLFLGDTSSLCSTRLCQGSVTNFKAAYVADVNSATGTKMAGYLNRNSAPCRCLVMPLRHICHRCGLPVPGVIWHNSGLAHIGCRLRRVVLDGVACPVSSVCALGVHCLLWMMKLICFSGVRRLMGFACSLLTCAGYLKMCAGS